MNWGEIPNEMLDASAQLRKAQDNLEKLVSDEINRRCYAWRMKVATILRERETIRDHLERGDSESALTLIRHNDAGWFRNTSSKEHIDELENCYLDLRPPA